MDLEILIWIQENIRSEAGDALMIFVTHTADLSAVWVLIALILMLDKRTRRAGFLVLVAIALCHVLNDMVLKEVLGRPRPFLAGTGYLPLVNASGYSMPSGHASGSFAAATVMMLYSRKAGAMAILYASLVAFTRLYAFAHYPSDVIAGAVLGIACAVSVFLIAERICPAEGRAPGGQ
ncbi:MAG: phosphatase PAP2 family protein [Candidatus Methanomethylophilaceae archaeon]|nr:phosphatase PAP2 family protein [Candidatus Methanomethylophilaceae archaeon]